MDLYKPALYQIRANNSRLSRRVVQVRGGRGGGEGGGGGGRGGEGRRGGGGRGRAGEGTNVIYMYILYASFKALFLFCSRSRLSQNISILIFGNNF